jgi:hypothetical protein
MAAEFRAILNIDVIGTGGKFYPAGSEITGKMAVDLCKGGAATPIKTEVAEKRSKLEKATLR